MRKSCSKIGEHCTHVYYALPRATFLLSSSSTTTAKVKEEGGKELVGCWREGEGGGREGRDDSSASQFMRLFYEPAPCYFFHYRNNFYHWLGGGREGG